MATNTSESNRDTDHSQRSTDLRDSPKYFAERDGLARVELLRERELSFSAQQQLAAQTATPGRRKQIPTLSHASRPC